MTLLELQHAFPPLVTRLIIDAYARGYTLTFAETYRPRETAELYAAQGRGTRTSLHTMQLAVDLNAFDSNGKYLTRSEEYHELGQLWKGYHVLARWGGDFAAADGNHFSLEYQGRK